MSLRHIIAVADLSGLTPTSKAVLYALAIDANAQGHVELRRPEVRRAAGCSERTLRGQLVSLEHRGKFRWTGETRSFLTLTL